MRSVSFVEHLEFEFSGNILERAIALGDVNNDGESELVVANITGNLAIFKGCNSAPWKRYCGLGMVSCIVIGDVCDSGRNVVFCITSEGWCHLMCFGKKSAEQDDSAENGDTNGDVVSTYHQLFPTNGKVALIGDVDGDGVNELVIASTDRVVRVFKWVKNEVQSKDLKTQLERSSVARQSSISSLKRFLSKDSCEDDKSNASDADIENSGSSQETSNDAASVFSGKFVCVKRWKLAGQVESLSVVEGRSGTSPALLVSQPGAGYIYLSCSDESVRENLQKQSKRLIPKSSAISFTDCYSSVDNSRAQHPLPRRSDMTTVPTHAISWCNRSTRRLSSTNLIAMCTLNGSLAVIKDEKMFWSMNLQHNFFTVQKLDITGNRKDEVIFCASNGETFIMDQYENVVNFSFGQDISAFCAGFFSRDDGESEPCLVYVTFNNRIRLYWNVKMSALESRNFNDTVVCRLDDFDMDPRFRDFIESEDGSLDNERIRQLTAWALYGAGVGAESGIDENERDQ